MGVIEWTDQMAQTLPFPVVRLFEVDNWKEWARNLIQYPTVSAFNPPDPEFFNDWREWAVRFNQVVGQLQ